MSFITYMLHEISLRWSNQGKWDGWDMWHIEGRWDNFVQKTWRWEDNTGMDLRERGLEVVDWIHLDQNRGHLWTLVNMVMNFWFHKWQRIYGLAEWLLASEGVLSMELVKKLSLSTIPWRRMAKWRCSPMYS